METKPESNVGKYVGRHLSQLKLMTRLMEHEVDAAKGGREVAVDRHLMENMIDTLEIFIEDCEVASGAQRTDRKPVSTADKPTVARLN
jgi:hypothetical protein